MSSIKNITIFNPKSVKHTLTKTERQILFEQLEIGSNVEKSHFESFIEMEEENIAESPVQSNISAIMIKNIIKYVTPIVIKKTSKEFNVTIQLASPLKVVNKELSGEHVISRETQINVSGVIFNNYKKNIINSGKQSVIQRADLSDLLLSGSFGVYVWKLDKNRYEFLQNLLDFKLEEKKIIVYFKDENNLKDSIGLLTDFSSYFETMIKESYLFTNMAIQHNKIMHKKQLNKKAPHSNTLARTPMLDFLDNIYTNKLTKSNNRMVMLYDIINGDYGIYTLLQKY